MSCVWSVTEKRGSNFETVFQINIDHVTFSYKKQSEGDYFYMENVKKIRYDRTHTG